MHLLCLLPSLPLSLFPPPQVDGIRFLSRRFLCGQGAILADDMGLGKSLQTIAFLHGVKGRCAREGTRFACLLLCPTSLKGNWQSEFVKWGGR